MDTIIHYNPTMLLQERQKQCIMVPIKKTGHSKQNMLTIQQLCLAHTHKPHGLAARAFSNQSFPLLLNQRRQPRSTIGSHWQSDLSTWLSTPAPGILNWILMHHSRSLARHANACETRIRTKYGSWQRNCKPNEFGWGSSQ